MDAEDARSEELARSRRHLRRKLSPMRTQFARILEHLDHMDAGDIDRIAELIHRMETEGIKDLRAELKRIHSEEQCQADLEREGLYEDEAHESEPSLWDSLRDAFKKRT